MEAIAGVEERDLDKPSSLLLYGINYDRKMFYSTAFFKQAYIWARKYYS